MTKLGSPLLLWESNNLQFAYTKTTEWFRAIGCFCILLHEWEEKAALLCWHFPLYMLM
jgi:hypothetical protein